jgi:hypothetical protein
MRCSRSPPRDDEGLRRPDDGLPPEDDGPRFEDEELLLAT